MKAWDSLVRWLVSHPRVIVAWDLLGVCAAVVLASLGHVWWGVSMLWVGTMPVAVLAIDVVLVEDES